MECLQNILLHFEACKNTVYLLFSSEYRKVSIHVNHSYFFIHVHTKSNINKRVLFFRTGKHNNILSTE